MRRASCSGLTRRPRRRGNSCCRRCSGDLPGGSAGAFVVHLVEPLSQLRLKIVAVMEPALLEERTLDPAHQVLDRPLLVGAPRPAHLGREPQLQRGVREDRIPLSHLAVLGPLQGHRLGSVEHRAQRHPAERHEMVGQGADQRLGHLVGHQIDHRPARPLQPRAEESHHLTAAVQVGDPHLAEVVLRELARQPSKRIISCVACGRNSAISS